MHFKHVAFVTLLWCGSHVTADAQQSKSPWTMSLSERFLSIDSRYGVDLSGSAPTLTTGARVVHEKGFEGGIGVSQLLGGIGGLERWYLSAGYTHEFSDVVSASAEFSHFEYPNDSLNILAALENLASFSIDLSFNAVSMSLSYDHYFNALTADFVSFETFVMIQHASWTFMPGIDLTFMSQNVPTRLLKSKSDKGVKGGANTLQTVNGFSSASITCMVTYALGKGFTASAAPTMMYAPQTDVSARTVIPVLSLGLRYSFGL